LLKKAGYKPMNEFIVGLGAKVCGVVAQTGLISGARCFDSVGLYYAGLPVLALGSVAAAFAMHSRAELRTKAPDRRRRPNTTPDPAAIPQAINARLGSPARPPPPQPDRRQSVREPVRLKAAILLAPRKTIACEALDLSPGGAKLLVPAHCMLPAEFELLVPARNLRSHVTSVWRIDDRLGVRFT
jgi:hypothetical protein